jgi:serine/threonine-protein kinase HipA
MKLAPGTPLSVALAFDASAQLPVARVAMDAGVAQLEWSPEVIARGLAVSPLKYPPEAGLHAASSRDREFLGLHGFLADSLPERWGTLVLRKRLAKLGIDITSLSPLDLLALVGRDGRGALVFEPAATPPDDVESLDLDALAADALVLLEGEEAKLADALAKLGGGSGGARPKVHVGFDGKGKVSVGTGEIAAVQQAWIVKFRAPTDLPDIGPIEEAYAAMAEAAGLTLSVHRLIAAKKGPGYFATRRFDRQGGKRLHMVSLAGAIEAPSDGPSSYDMFLRATRAITRRTDDVAAAFQRMVFNILAHNRDDHTRQHAYLMDTNGEWRLAPAYDLTYAPGPGGEHYLDVEGEGRHPTRAHVVKLGKRHGLSEKHIAEIIDKTRAAVSGWPKFAKSAGVSATSAKLIGEAHARVWAKFGSE